MACSPGPTGKVCCTCGAELNAALPAWLAAMMHVPAPMKNTDEPDIEQTNGVLVENVENAGWAGLGGVREGDLIQRIDTYEITSLEDYRKAHDATILLASHNRSTSSMLCDASRMVASWALR